MILAMLLPVFEILYDQPRFALLAVGSVTLTFPEKVLTMMVLYVPSIVVLVEMVVTPDF